MDGYIYIADSIAREDQKTNNDRGRNHAFKGKNSIGREIGDIIIQTNSSLLEELKEDIVNGDGTIDEIAEVKSITFYDSWNEIILLEILAGNIEFV